VRGGRFLTGVQHRRRSMQPDLGQRPRNRVGRVGPLVFDQYLHKLAKQLLFGLSGQSPLGDADVQHGHSDAPSDVVTGPWTVWRGAGWSYRLRTGWRRGRRLRAGDRAVGPARPGPVTKLDKGTRPRFTLKNRAERALALRW